MSPQASPYPWKQAYKLVVLLGVRRWETLESGSLGRGSLYIVDNLIRQAPND